MGNTLQQKQALVLGLGIGAVYLEQLTTLDFNVVTVDNKIAEATYKTMDDVPEDMTFTIVVSCLPNYLHEESIHKFAKRTTIFIVEKPGLASLEDWNRILQQYSRTYIFMAKNNAFRMTMPELGRLFKNYIQLNLIKSFEICWLNDRRIPYPGSWFTNKELAFGGVSRDLMPHILSVLFALGFPIKKFEEYVLGAFKHQQFTLDEITSTSYGTIDKNGVYDVDDVCEMLLEYNSILIKLQAAWDIKNNSEYFEHGFYINLYLKTGESLHYFLDLCPNIAYGTMCNFYLKIVENELYDEIASQYDVDRLIHRAMELFINGDLSSDNT